VSEEFLTKAAAKEAKSVLKAQADHRKTLEKKGALNPILNEKDVGGVYELTRQLLTKIDGKNEVINASHLKRFRENIDKFNKQAERKGIRGGIRPHEIIALSNVRIQGDRNPKTDVGRANEEIHRAVLAGANGGVLRFITDVGKDSKDIRHHVTVQLLAYERATVSPETQTNPKKLTKEVCTDRVKFDCDCGRHRYWLRYIATIGGWAYGRQENGFPDQKNPHLKGVACKHIIRVMRELTSSSAIQLHVERMIVSKAKIVVKQADMAKQAAAQKKNIKAIDPKKAKIAADKIKKQMQGLNKALKKAKLKPMPNQTRQVNATANMARDLARKLSELSFGTPEFNETLAALNALKI
jgi:hypothetical protein